MLTVIAIVLAVVLHGSQSLDYKIRLDAQGNFVDPWNRVLYFHGINSVRKSFPWYDSSVLDSNRLHYYKEWGFNFVRLGVIWTGTVPDQPGSVNATYLQIMETIVNSFDKFGLVTLLDMHQDVLTSLYGSYDGVPRWLVKSLPSPPKVLSYPWPLNRRKIEKNWAEGYLTYAISSAFQSIYDNESRSLEYWGDFWAIVARTFHKKNSVIGYELINEPWAGNIYSNPLRILPGYTGKNNLLPVYEYLVDKIRNVDNQTLIFYEPVTWGVFEAGDSLLGSGFHRTPNNDKMRSVFSYHYYCWMLQNADPKSVYPHWEQLLCDKILLQRIFKVVKENLVKIGGGSFLTEFGLCAPDNSTRSINSVECRSVLDQADANLQSWAYWDSHFFSESTDQPLWNTVKVFARAYPRAVSGQTQMVTFDPNTAIFRFSFRVNTMIDKSTDIFLPTKVHYRSGFEVSIIPSNGTAWQFEWSEFLLKVLINPAIIRDASLIEVLVHPKSV